LSEEKRRMRQLLALQKSVNEWGAHLYVTSLQRESSLSGAQKENGKKRDVCEKNVHERQSARKEKKLATTRGDAREEI